MTIKRITISYGILISAGLALSSFAENTTETNSQNGYQKPIEMTTDSRISLNLPPPLKTRQLIRMRSHFKTLQSIVSLIADEKFIEASELARVNLGRPQGNQSMANQINNESFKSMGTAFHQSAETLSEVLKTKDTKKSLQALNTTMGYCVQCHEVFRQ
jgi:predicted lipoprotein